MLEKIFRKIVSAQENVGVRLYIAKMWYGEQAFLRRIKPLVAGVKWSAEQQSQFDDFWEKNYGKKISSKGNKHYESINQSFSERYFPNFLFTTKLEPKLNNLKYCQFYSDKALTELLYAKSDITKMPRTLLLKSDGIWYDSKRNIIEPKNVQEVLTDLGEVIIKPTTDSSGGKGVMLCNFVNGKDINNKINLNVLLNSNNFIVQERMKQHSSYSKLHPQSVNTLRISTFIVESKIYHSPLCLRMGVKGSHIDNGTRGGIVVGVTDDGILLKYAHQLGPSDPKHKVTHHPDTNIKFEGYKIEKTKELIEAAKELHTLTPHIGMVSWDLMLSEDKQPILLEGNFLNQSIKMSQITHGKPFFGENTEYMLKLLRK